MKQVRRLQPFVAIKEKNLTITLPSVVVAKTKSGEKNLEHRHRRRVFLSVEILGFETFCSLHCSRFCHVLLGGKNNKKNKIKIFDLQLSPSPPFHHLSRVFPIPLNREDSKRSIPTNKSRFSYMSPLAPLSD